MSSLSTSSISTSSFSSSSISSRALSNPFGIGQLSIPFSRVSLFQGYPCRRVDGLWKGVFTLFQGWWFPFSRVVFKPFFKGVVPGVSKKKPGSKVCRKFETLSFKRGCRVHKQLPTTSLCNQFFSSTYQKSTHVRF